MSEARDALGLDAALLLLRRPLMVGFAYVVGSLCADGPNGGDDSAAMEVRKKADERSGCADEAVAEKG